MEIKVNPDLSITDWTEISALFEKIQWGYRAPAQIQSAFEKSSHTVFAFDSNKLVGFGRTVDDGQFYAMIADLVVDPNYQGKGIGKTMINKLTEQLAKYNFVTLTSEPSKGEFYQKIGWRKQSSAYIWPKNDFQLSEHCEKDT